MRPQLAALAVVAAGSVAIIAIAQHHKKPPVVAEMPCPSLGHARDYWGKHRPTNLTEMNEEIQALFPDCSQEGISPADLRQVIKDIQAFQQAPRSDTP